MSKLLQFLVLLSIFSSYSKAEEKVSGKCAIGFSLAVGFLIENDHATYEENARRHFTCQIYKDSVGIAVLNFDKTYLVAQFYSSTKRGEMMLNLSKTSRRWSKILDSNYLF